MDNELRTAINKHIHKLRGLCWHDIEVEGTATGFKAWCKFCDDAEAAVTVGNPDYTSSKSPRYLLEDAVAKVKETVGIAAFNRVLLGLFVSDYAREVAVLALTAEQIALAIYNATGGEKL